MARVLVTGATGFVGRALCAELAEDGYAVRGTSRSGTPGPLATPLPLVETVPVPDIDGDTDWRPALRDVDCVVHLAARVHVLEAAAPDPLAAYRRTNVAGTRRLAEAAAAGGVRRLVFASSVKANGETSGERPFAETDPPAPADPYGVSKWEAERTLADIAARTGLEVVILRPPLVYGPGGKGHFLTLLRLCALGVPLPLAGVANARSLLFVGNLTGALRTALAHPRAAGNTYLVSDGEDVSTPELVRRLAAAMGRPARLVAVPPWLLRSAGRLAGRGEEAKRLLASLAVDSGRIRRDLGWVPPYTLDEGLRRTVEWFAKERR